jgi:hypothetical protein
VWPGFDDRNWSLGDNHWMDRQDTVVYQETWKKVHEYNQPLSMPWVMVETWNHFNEATEVEPSTDWDYKFIVLTRDNARRFKGSLPADSVGVDNMGLLVPQHIHQARIAARLRPDEATAINGAIDQAMEKFFDREHLTAVSLVDQAAGLALEPFTVQAVGDTFVTLSWTASAQSNLYRVYYSTDAARFEPCAFEKPEVITVAGLGTQLNGLVAGTHYFIAVTAMDGNLGPYANESWYENVLTGHQIVEVTTLTQVAPNLKTMEDIQMLPTVYELSQAYPNPFNAQATVRFALPDPGQVVVKVYDLRGREIQTLVDEHREAGFYAVVFDASNLSSGMYIIRMTSGTFIASRKMTLMK